MHVTEEGPAPGGFVNVLDNDHPWRRHGENARPPMAAVVVPAALDRGFATAQPCGRRKTNHRRQIREHAADAGVRKSRVVEPDVEGLNRVANRTRVQAPKRIKVDLRNQRFLRQASTPAKPIAPLPPASESAWIGPLKLYNSPRQPMEIQATARNQDNNQRTGNAKMKLVGRRWAQEAVEFAQAHGAQGWRPA